MIIPSNRLFDANSSSGKRRSLYPRTIYSIHRHMYQLHSTWMMVNATYGVVAAVAKL